MAVWSKVSSRCNFRAIFPFSFSDLKEAPYFLRGDEDFKKAMHAVNLETTWSLWKHRYSIIFEREHPSSMKVVCEVMALASLW